MKSDHANMRHTSGTYHMRRTVRSAIHTSDNRAQSYLLSRRPGRVLQRGTLEPQLRAASLQKRALDVIVAVWKGPPSSSDHVYEYAMGDEHASPSRLGVGY